MNEINKNILKTCILIKLQPVMENIKRTLGASQSRIQFSCVEGQREFLRIEKSKFVYFNVFCIRLHVFFQFLFVCFFSY